MQYDSNLFGWIALIHSLSFSIYFQCWCTDLVFLFFARMLNKHRYLLKVVNRWIGEYSCSDLMPEPAVRDFRSSSVSQHVVLHALHTGVLSHFRAKCRLIVLHLCKHKYNPWIRHVLQIITSGWSEEKYPYLVSCFMWHHVSVICTFK